jgi:hypothetical protein
MNKYSIVPSSYKNKVSDDNGLQISVEVESTRKELIEFDRDINVDLNILYDKEKGGSFNIRPIFNINFIYDNTYSGITTSKYKNELIYPILNTFYVQTNNAKGFLRAYEFDFFRPPTLTAFGYETPNAYTYNWNYYLTYPYANDSKQQLSITIKGKSFDWDVEKGIPFVSEKVVVNGFNIVKITCWVEHNIKEGESVLIDGVVYDVYSFGDGSFNSEKYIINILNIKNNIASNVPNTLKRVIIASNSGETTSIYYIRKHKVISGGNKIVVTKAGFQRGVFDGRSVLSYNNDSFSGYTKESNYSYNFTLQNEINIDGIVDNHNRPITELYLTIVFKGQSGFFASRNDSMKKGWGFNILKNNKVWWESRNPNSNSNIGTTSYFDNDNKEFFYYKHPDEFDGDFCEYNEYEQIERVVSDFYYKIKHSQSIFDINDNEKGYYYKPHNKLQLKVFSDYVETVDKNLADNIPNYAFFSKIDNQFRWRDIYSVGFFDENNNGVNYPFINGSFYPFVNNIFKLFPEGYDYEKNVFNTTNSGENPLIVKPIIDECE